jgi:hypothetical protein
MLGRLIGVSMIIAATALWLMFHATTPSIAGPLGVLLVFILLYVLALGVLTFLLFWSNRLLIKIMKLVSPEKVYQPMTFLRSYYFSSVLALAPIILVSMQSVGGASVYDIVLVLLFVVVACFYVAKRTL